MQTGRTRRLASKMLTAHQNGFSWRRVSVACKVLTVDGNPNPSLAQKIAEKGYEPKGIELRTRLGLVPPVRARKPLTPFQVAHLQMAEATKRVLKGWKVTP